MNGSVCLPVQVKSDCVYKLTLDKVEERGV